MPKLPDSNSNRRAERRLRTEITIDLGNNTIKAALQDISRTGIGFRTCAFLLEAQSYHFRLRLPNGKSIIGELEICWKTEQAGMQPTLYGARFSKVGSTSQEVLNAFIVESSKP